MAIASSEVASYPQGDPHPHAGIRRSIALQTKNRIFSCWAINIPPLSLACLTILYAALITSGGTVFNKGPLRS